MAENAPERKVDAPQKGPKDVAAEQQKDLKGAVEGAAVMTVRWKTGQVPSKVGERKDAITPEAGKKYLAKGEVNKVPFKQELRDYKWYLIFGTYARHMVRDFNRIDFQFPGLKNEKARLQLQSLLRKISSASIDAAIPDDQQKAADTFRKFLDTAGSKEGIYGSEGILNVILAYGRASDTLRGVTEGNAGSIDYQLKLVSNDKPLVSRLFVKKQVDEKKQKAAQKTAAQQAPSAKQKVPETGKSKGDIFNEDMEKFFNDREELIARIRACREKEQMSHEVERELVGALYNLHYQPISSKEPSDEDYTRLKLNENTMNTTRAQVEAAEKASVAQKVMEKTHAADLPSSITSVDVPNAGHTAPKEDYLTREKRMEAEVVIKEGNLEKNYVWNEDKLDEMAASIAHDVVDAVSPAVTDLRFYEKLIQPLILASLRNDLNVRHSARANGETVPSNYRMSEGEKVRYITVLLSQMKTTGTIRSKKVI